MGSVGPDVLEMLAVEPLRSDFVAIIFFALVFMFFDWLRDR